MSWGSAPSLDDFAALAEAAFARLPEAFRRMTGEVVFRVEDFADEETLESLGIEDPFELTGLYQGVDLASRSILDDWAENGEITLEELVTHVLVHEIGHHFGLSDAQIHAIEAQAD